MSRDEILNMPAGREMDALIARMVFGCHLKHRRDTYFCSCEGIGPLKFAPHGDIETNEIPEYSTDIAAAWEVVDATHVYIHTLRRVVNDDPDTPALWQALIYADTYKAGYGDTAPLAICRAALLATLGDASESSGAGNQPND